MPFLALLVAAVSALPQDAPEPYGSWMAKPEAEWPPFVLVNMIEYEDAKHPVAGCGFLIEVEGERFAVTAKHVLTYFKSAAMGHVDFADTLKSWTMAPKHRPQERVEVGELVNRDPSESVAKVPCDRDWLLFRVRKASPEIPALRLRETPLVAGEPIFIVGWRYTEKDCPPIVHRGTFLRREKDAVVVSAESLFDNKIPGLSGAPVLDAKGYVVGIMSRGSGRLQRLSPVEYPLAVIERVNAPGRPARTPASSAGSTCSRRRSGSRWPGATRPGSPPPAPRSACA